MKHTLRLPYIAKWLVITTLVGACVGSASAGFLFSLEWATATREAHRWIIAFLPAAGFAAALLYRRFGKGAEKGTDLLIGTIFDPEERIHFRMAPFIYVATIATHLFGGSAGREGTALQMAGAITDQFSKPLGLEKQERKVLMIAGIAAGFGSVFGTPVAGAVFALEFYRAGRINHEAIFPAFAAAIIADTVARLWGVTHAPYALPALPGFEPFHILLIVAAGVAFGICAIAFTKLMEKTSALLARLIGFAPLRPVAGGVIVAALVFASGSTRYVGLGESVIAECFTGRAMPWDFALKIAFTALTLGSGFKGGEVTPLFFIGATLGNALAWLLPLNPALLSAAGLVAVFAGASNTPLACTVLAFELFGPACGRYAAIACIVSYIVSGQRSLYRAQDLTAKNR